MTITGEMPIGRAAIRGAGQDINGVAAATGERLEPTFRGATPEPGRSSLRPGGAAFDAYRETPRGARGQQRTRRQNLLKPHLR